MALMGLRTIFRREAAKFVYPGGERAQSFMAYHVFEPERSLTEVIHPDAERSREVGMTGGRGTGGREDRGTHSLCASFLRISKAVEERDMVMREYGGVVASARSRSLPVDSRGDGGLGEPRLKANDTSSAGRVRSFSELRRAVHGGGVTTELTNFHALRQRLFHGALLSPRELIALQIRAGEIGLSVEIVSKIADGLLGVARRLQTPQ